MPGNRYSEKIKTAVLKYGATGKTYAEISSKYGVPKSTLSVWFNAGNKGRGDRTLQLVHLSKARKAAHVVIRQRKAARIADAQTRARDTACRVPLENIEVRKSLLAMLYWAEGTKTDPGSLIFVNTDPVLASFYLRLLRSTIPIDESKLRVRLHLHYYHSHPNARRYWSELLAIPESQFGKIYVKKRSKRKKFRRNFQGICSIVYADTQLLREILALGRILAENMK